jgi:hypothetical protein
MFSSTETLNILPEGFILLYQEKNFNYQRKKVKLGLQLYKIVLHSDQSLDIIGINSGRAGILIGMDSDLEVRYAGRII